MTYTVRLFHVAIGVLVIIVIDIDCDICGTLLLSVLYVAFVLTFLHYLLQWKVFTASKGYREVVNGKLLPVFVV